MEIIRRGMLMKEELRVTAGVKVNNNEMIRLGEGAILDATAILGYLPARGGHLVLSIGPQAHIRSGTVIYGGSRIGCNLETGHNVVIREENEIGDNFRIWNNSVVDYGCRIGNNVKIHTNVYVSQFTAIEDGAFLGSGVTLANVIHPGCPDAAECMHGPTIKRGAQIGVNCTVLPRIIIGENVVVAPGSVVTKDIPDGLVASGNPAQIICEIRELTCLTGLRDKPYNNNKY
jgi:acetyltransferase-like isoleucine patch superfamily enzyme